jgi:hypothetical protein
MRNAYKILIGKPKGRRLLGRHVCRWEDNIKMDFKEYMKGWNGFMWLKIGMLVGS